MHSIDLRETTHQFVKKNLMTLKDSKGHYDDMVCSLCDVTGKRRAITHIEIDGRISYLRALKCPYSEEKQRPKRIKITVCEAQGRIFENVTPNSIHEVINPAVGYKDDHKGVWIMGVGEPVKVLNGEFVVLE